MQPTYLFLWKQRLRSTIEAYTMGSSLTTKEQIFNLTSREQVFPDFFNYLSHDEGWEKEFENTIAELKSRNLIQESSGTYQFAINPAASATTFSYEEQSVISILNNNGGQIGEGRLRDRYKKDFVSRIGAGYYTKIAEELLTELMEDGDIFEWKELEQAAVNHPGITLQEFLSLKKQERLSKQQL